MSDSSAEADRNRAVEPASTTIDPDRAAIGAGRRDPWPWIALASGIAFLVLASLVVHRGGLAFDEPVATAVRSLPIPVWAWRLITALGGAFLAVVGTAFVVGSLLSRRLRLALIVALVLIAASLFTHVVKDYVTRPRPPWEQFAPAPGFSFPSGHTLNSTVSYGLLAVVAWRSGARRNIRRLAVAIGLTLPLAIGLSRIALGVHYPSDVLGGWLGGIAFVGLAATLIRLTEAMDRDLPWRTRHSPTGGP
ncbi:MAG TPA: phosphatase PAP2 family protein [Candidatus Limnocylindrales bacterium]